MSYSMTKTTHKITAEMIADLELHYPFAKGTFSPVDSLEMATEKVISEINKSLPTQECVIDVLEATEDAQSDLYLITVKILD